jgi:hypothetical protein
MNRMVKIGRSVVFAGVGCHICFRGSGTSGLGMLWRGGWSVLGDGVI